MKQFESFGLDEQNECLWHNGAQIMLPPRAFAMLRYLVENPGRLVSHDELLDKLWPDTYVQPQVLRTYVLELRKLLSDDARQPRFIRSLPKRGYVFLASVTETGNGRPVIAVPVKTPKSEAAGATVREPAGRELVGREKELNALRSCVERLAGKTRQMVLISGDVGMGKTALIDTFVNEWAATGEIAVARGQCVQGISAREQYYPVLEALAHLCASPDGERACRILARVAPSWLPGSLREGAAHIDTSRTSAGTASDLCAALEELTAEKPLALILENIHWADEATLDAISALAHRRMPAKLMVVATIGSHETGAGHPVERLRQSLCMQRLCTELTLNPLTKVHTAELLRMKLEQSTLPSGLDAFVHQHAEGNPLFAVAILDHLIAERFLMQVGTGADTRWGLRAPLVQSETGIPAALAQMMEVEIARLPAAEQRLLEAASLINVAFPAWAVAAALEEDIAATEDACDSLAHRVSFIRRAGHDELPDGTRSAFYVFAHGLYREVLYQRQSAARRARRHTRVAERLRRIFAGREFDVAHEIAMHFEAAGDWIHAIETLRTAAHAVGASKVSAEELLIRAQGIAANLNAEERDATTREIRETLESIKDQTLVAPQKRTRQMPARKLDVFSTGT
jgi:predicted ATPase/DNA-binding winged helix-turn-helix (wHTH) protein